ncbi:hypothetical protein ACFU0W_08235 [Microbacterium keratanolyticum]|uniref:hypothetical protein n=1 Tax=Microbacterium keratanolyticum TaxID=67574 RepID=UPI00362E77A1
MSAFPADWAPGTWRISGSALDGGWLAIPSLADAAQQQAWIAENTGLLREAWGDQWTVENEALVPLALQAALDRRRPDDALAFQLWPLTIAVCAFVHVAMGSVDAAEPMPGPGDGVLFDSAGLGQGVLSPRLIDADGAALVGYDAVFSFDGVVVVVSVEPTFADFLGVISPSIHAFMDGMELVDPEGTTRRASAPALLEAQPVNTWVDSLTAS